LAVHDWRIGQAHTGMTVFRSSYRPKLL